MELIDARRPASETPEIPSPPPGCRFTDGAAEFAVWAPDAQNMEWFGGSPRATVPMRRGADGWWTLKVGDFRPGDRYGYMPDGKGPFPDPASRFQPDGVHGLSQGVDLSRYPWRYPCPMPPPPARRSIYELHVGTFTPEGTFAAARARLPSLRELGVALIELMPVADFPGGRNWGYDGVALFAPARCYGTPEDLCALIDEAHGLGLGVLLDVVYNHFGPDGNYTGVFSAGYMNHAKQTPWGSAINLDGPGSRAVRGFFLANAAQWIADYRFDGLRLDATHALRDDSDPHFVAELAASARAAAGGRAILIYAEDHRNPAHFLAAPENGGFGLDGVWADDLHHHLRRRTAGDSESYYARYDGSLPNIAATLSRGWYRDGSAAEGPLAEGSNPDPFPYDKFVVCIQNHDQVGNRAFGDRIHHQVSLPVYRALSALLLLAPETPLLFMGQEWACSSPFLFITDHHPELGALVTAGRRKEFAGFSAFREAEARSAIPDPQGEAAFLASRLDWGEREKPPHAAVLAFHRALLEIRNQHPAFDSTAKGRFRAIPSGGCGLACVRQGSGSALAFAVCLDAEGGEMLLPAPPAGGAWRPLLDSEDPRFAADPHAPGTTLSPDGNLAVRFARAGAWIGDA